MGVYCPRGLSLVVVVGAPHVVEEMVIVLVLLALLVREVLVNTLDGFQVRLDDDINDTAVAAAGVPATITTLRVIVILHVVAVHGARESAVALLAAHATRMDAVSDIIPSFTLILILSLPLHSSIDINIKAHQ